MKFVLKVLVLVCLIVMSKLSKDEAITMQRPLAKGNSANAVFTSTANSEHSQLAERKQSPVSLKFEKGSLHLN